MGIKVTGDLAKLYGDKEGYMELAADVINKMAKTTPNVGQDFVHSALAPSFSTDGVLELGLKLIDDKLKLLIATANKLILEIPPQKRNWDAINACFLQNPCAKPKNDSTIGPLRQLSHFKKSNFKFDGSPDSQLVNEVLQWWRHTAISDQDILVDTKVDIQNMAEFVARSGAAVTNLFTVFRAEEHRERRVLDIGVLRYPDHLHPYFKVYRIELFAYVNCQRTLWHQVDDNGIKSVLSQRLYEPEEDFIRDVSKETKKRALKYVDSLFSV